MKQNRNLKNAASPKSRKSKVMKKVFFSTVIAFLVFSSINAQTSSQREMIYSFFRLEDTKEAIRHLHPTCNFYGASITSISDNTVYFYAKFKDTGLLGSGNIFTCRCSLIIDSYGKFRRLQMERCGNIHDDDGVVECGGALTVGSFINYVFLDNLLETDHPAVELLEEQWGEKLYQFWGRRLVCTALFCIWYNEGYYRRY